jgi:hypothetical protein
VYFPFNPGSIRGTAVRRCLDSPGCEPGDSDPLSPHGGKRGAVGGVAAGFRAACAVGHNIWRAIQAADSPLEAPSGGNRFLISQRRAEARLYKNRGAPLLSHEFQGPIRQLCSFAPRESCE